MVAPLVRLGVGTALISKEQDDTLRAADKKINNTYGKPIHGVRAIFVGLFAGYYVVTGEGAASPLANRVSAVTFWFYMAGAAPNIYCWVLSLHMACTLIAAKVNAISTTLKQELSNSTSMSDEEWQRAVVVPCKALVPSMRILTEHWAGEIVRICWFFTCILLSFSCAHLSQTLQIPLGFKITMYMSLVLCIYIPIAIAGGPACISTACDDMVELLNALTLKDLSMHSRVFPLLMCLKQTNHGQGLGFLVGGFVLDMKALGKITAELVAAVMFLAPVIASYAVDGQATAAAVQGLDTCGLSAFETQRVQAAMLGHNSSCSYENVWLGSVLRLKTDDQSPPTECVPRTTLLMTPGAVNF